jgi:pancreas-specific transcription factor 1a
LEYRNLVVQFPNTKMFSMDTIDFETVMSRHLFEGSLLHPLQAQANHSSNSNSSNDYFLCDDESITDGESFNSDQENNNNEIKE